MKSKKALSTAIAFLSGLVTISLATAQDRDLTRLDQQQRSNLEIYLDHADQAQTQEQWLRIAQFGVQTVVAQWETSAAQLVDQGMDLPSERDRLEGGLNGLLGERFAQWLIRKAFSEQARMQSAELCRAILQANLQKLYKTDENGIIYDSSGDPEMYQTANLKEDQADWEEAVSQALRTELESWNAHAAAIRTELLTYLPDGMAFEGQFTATEQQYRAAYQRELDTQFQREESRFLNARIRDQLSLRKKSEDETAASVVSRIITSANAEMSIGLQKLRDSLSTEHSAAPEGEITIDPSAWQESFRREFDKGMARWSQAEQDLLLQRAQWEKSVADQYQDGEREWASAYKQLQDARTQWQSQISEILDTGRTQWETKQSDLSAAIEEARIELSRSIETRSQSLDTTVSNVTTLCKQAANILHTADSSLEYWEEQDQAASGVAEAITFWNATRATYQKYYNDALDFLADTATQLNGGEPGTVSYTGILGTDAIDDLYLDDYQVALLGAKATEAYWQKQVDIAAAVVAYAHDTSSLRPTKTQSEDSYQEAWDAFKSKQVLYQAALAALEACGADLGGKREKIQQLNAELETLDAELKAARQEYQAIIDLFGAEDDSSFRLQLQGYYKDLCQKSGLSKLEDEQAKTELTAYADYLAAMNVMGMEQTINGAAQAVSRLVLGDSVSGVESLRALSEAANQAKGWRFSEQRSKFLDSLNALGITATDAQTAGVFNQLSQEHDAYMEADPGSIEQGLARLRIVGFANQLVGQKEDDLARRLAEIALLTSPDLAQWANSQNLSVEPAADFESIRASIKKNADGSLSLAYLEQARAQKAILEVIAAHPQSVSGIAAFSSQTSPSALSDSAADILSEVFAACTGLSDAQLSEEALRCSSALQKIIDVLGPILESDDPALTAHSVDIRALAQSNDLARSFLAGSSMFAFGGADYGHMVLTDSSRKAAMSQYLASVLIKDERVAPAIKQQVAQAAVVRLQNLLVDYKIATSVSGDTVTFRNAADVFRDVWDMKMNAAGVEAWLQELQQDIAELSTDLPQPVISQMQSLMQSLSELFALQVMNRNATASASRDARNAIDALSDRMNGVLADLTLIRSGRGKPENDPAALLAALRSVQAIQSAGGFDSSTALAVAVTVGDVSARFVSESAIRIAQSLYALHGSSMVGDTIIVDSVNQYLSSSSLESLMSDPAIASLVPGITSSLRNAVRSIYARVCALSNPVQADWSTITQEVKAEYASSVWNTCSPEWFAGVRDDATRDILVTTDAARLDVLHSIHESLAGSWGAEGVNESAWNEYLLSEYYGDRRTSFSFDRNLANFEFSINSNAAEGQAYAGIARSFLKSTPISENFLSPYAHAAAMKKAIDDAIDGMVYDEQTAQSVAAGYLSAHPEANTTQMTLFINGYLDLFRGTADAVDVDVQKVSWLELLRGQLGGGALSTLSATTQFMGVAAVDLVCSVAGALVDEGFTGCDFGLLKEVLVDVNLSDEERALMRESSASACQSALDAYLAGLVKNDDALAGDDADRGFELARLYTRGYLGCDASQREEFRKDFRAMYLSGNLDKLDAALLYYGCLRSLGSADRDAWFAKNVLSPAGQDRVSAIAFTSLESRTGVDANERALALGINYDLAQLNLDEDERISLTGWILSVSACNAPARIDALIRNADGQGNPLPVNDALLLLLGSPEAALWILKRKIRAGKKIDADREKVDSSVWSQAQAFQKTWSAKNGYIPAAETGPVEYGAQITGSGSFEDAVRTGAYVSADAWDDPAFALPYDASGGDILSSAAGVESAQTSVALDYIASLLSSEPGRMALAQQGLGARLIFDQQLEQLEKGLDTSALAYRAYINDSLMKVTGANAPDPAAQQQAPEVKISDVTTSEDKNGILCVDSESSGGSPGPVYENALLQGVSDFRLQSNRFNDTVAKTASADTSLQSSFYDGVAAILKDASQNDASRLIADWSLVESDSFDLMGESKARAVATRDVLRSIEAQAASSQQQIVFLGSALAKKMILGREKCAEATQDVLAEIDQLTGGRESMKNRYEDSLTRFEEASASYKTLFDKTKTALDERENARFILQKAEAINIFAATGYLGVDAREMASGEQAPDSQNAADRAVDPDQRLAAAQAGHLKAQAGLDALLSLYSTDGQPKDFIVGNSAEQGAYFNAFKDYQRQYSAYLAMEQLSALLSSAVAKQQKNVADAQGNLEKSIELLIGAAPTTFAFGSGEAPKTQDYVQISQDQDPRMLPGFSFGSYADSGQRTALTAYLTSEGDNTFASDREIWVQRLSEYIEIHGDSFISDWSLAFQKQMEDLGLEKTGVDEKYKALFSGYNADTDSIESPGRDCPNSVLNKEGIASYDADSQLRNAAYTRVMNDSEQEQLYEFFIAMNMLGLIGPNSITCDTLTDRYIADAKAYLVAQLEPKRQAHLSSAQSTATAGVVMQLLAIAFLNPFTWPAYLMYEGLAIIMWGVSAGQTADANNIAVFQQGLNNALNGASGLENGVAEAKTSLGNSTIGAGGYLDAKKKRDDEQSKLDTILGVVTGRAIATTDVVSAITAAANVQKQTSIDEVLALANTGITDPSELLDLSGLITRYFSAATGGAQKASDAATAITYMLYACQTKRDNALSDVMQEAATLADSQLEKDEAYQTALANLQKVSLEDAVRASPRYHRTVQSLNDAARAAYLNPIYRAKDHLNRMLTLEQTLQGSMDTVKHPELCQAQQDLLDAQQHEMQAMLQDRMSHYIEAQEKQWAQMEEELSDQEIQWQASMQAIMKRADSQWEAAFRQLDQEYGKWESRFASAYEDRAATWDTAYIKLETGKAGWIRNAADSAALIGSKAVLSQLGQSAESGIRDAGDLIVSALGIAAPDARGALESILKGKDFASLIKSGKVLNQGIASARETVFARLGPDIFDTAQVLRKVLELGSLNTEEIDKQVLLITAREARKAVEEASRQMNSQIGDANQSVADGLNRTLVEAGFVRSGDHYERETVVDSTINGPVKELHTVRCYQPFVPDAPVATSVDLGDAKLAQFSARGIQAQVDLAIKDMKGQWEKIFGEQDENGSIKVRTWTTTEHSEKVTTAVYVKDGENSGHYEDQTTTRYWTTRDEGAKDAEIGAGQFGTWVGASPEMDEKPDATAGQSEFSKYLSAEGSGQMSLVITPFLWSQLKQGMGWAQVSRPIYDQKLWDDRTTWVKAPTMRSVADVGVAVLGTAIGGVGGVLAGLVEKGLFAAADVGNKQLTVDEGLVSFGKNALSSALTFGMGELGSAVSTALQATGGIGGVIANTMWTGAKSVMTNLGQGLISSVTYTSGGSFGFDSAAITQAVVGQDALAGYLGSMASMATSGVLAGNLVGFSALNQRDVMSVANLAGGIVNSGIKYGMTGETTLNVLNFADLSGNRDWNTGLVEMHLGGSEGFSTNLGIGGTDVSLGTIARAVQGMGTFVKQQEIRWYDATGRVNIAQGYNENREAGTLLRESYSFGDAQAKVQLDRLLSGQDMLRVGYIGNEGETVVQDGARAVNLATLGMSGDINSQLAAGIVLGHEAYRNGIDNGIVGQQWETAAAVLGHTEMALRVAQEYGVEFIAGNENLAQDAKTYLAGAAAFASYVGAAYDSSADYWKVIKHKNGTLTMEDDGSNDVTVVDENGQVVGYKQYTGGSRTGFIASALGLDTATVNQLMGPQGGWTYNKATGKFDLKAGYSGVVTFKADQAAAISNLYPSAPTGIISLAVNAWNGIISTAGWLWGKATQALNWVQYQAALRGEYYRQTRLTAMDFGGQEITTQADTNQHNYSTIDWYEDGHPGVDVMGQGSFEYARALELLKTDDNERLLYKVSGTNDYLFLTHVPADDIARLAALLSASATGSVQYQAGETLFGYPTSVSDGDKSTGPHIHAELYRQQTDGSYWFADPTTGKSLPNYDFRYSVDGVYYINWRRALPTSGIWK
ncbi:MAG: hypothetical protein ABSF77_12805 [Spirochaetia bacterium]